MFKYTESPDFQVLLLAYSVNNDPVQVIDLANGETLPRWLIEMLYDPSYIKHAYNAAFELTCLPKYLGAELPVEQWRCTMAHGLYCGYPAGLDAVSKALGLDSDKQKLNSGKALIRYFCVPCKPSRSNGNRTRNFPHHEPVRWKLFKEYCAQDVVAEMAVARKFAAFPMPADIQRQWVTDYHINARGVAVDMRLVKGALSIGNNTRAALMDAARQISGLSNPNSLQQLTEWLEKEMDEEIESLDKESVTGLLNRENNSDAAQRMLEIRQELGKTSTKKYDAVEASVCSDGRVRGLLQFYGANRTGRWCLTGDHEVLTPAGWLRLDEWTGGEVACWASSTEYISFQKAVALSFDYSGEMFSVIGQRCEQISTPDHKMAVLHKQGHWESRTMESLGQHRFTIPFTGRRIITCASDNAALRVLIMVQADGHYTHEGDIRFHFSKTRKIERCKKLLRGSGIPFIFKVRPNGNAIITIKNRHAPLWLRQFQTKTFGYWLLDESPDVVFDELQYWDAYKCGPNSVQYGTINKQNAEVLQAAALLSGRSATLLTKPRTDERWQTNYILNIWNSPGHGTAIRREQISKVYYEGKVYCAETPTGYFLIRRNGKVWVTGNSGRQIQTQNLPRTYIEPLSLARELTTAQQPDALKIIYGSIPDTLSQLIRTCFVAAPGRILLDADFSSIEARVLAWLAGERWKLDVFRTHGKIYEASASQMFGVPLERIAKGNPEYALRQKGKVAELALGYQGSTGALIKMGALKMGLSEDELPDIVSRWRDSNRRIRDLWYALENAAITVVTEGRSVDVGCVFLYREVDRANGLDYMTIRLPSGRKLYYANPTITSNQWGKPAVLYMGVEQNTKKWGRVDTYGGKLVENITQAVARDCLACAIERLEAAGYEIVMHCHDEVVIDCPTESADLDDVTQIMAEPMPWAPDLPLAADGWLSPYFKKD